MKSKNRVSKLATSAIVSAVLGAVMGSLLTTFTDIAVKKIPIDPLYIVMFFAVLVTTLSFLILFRVETVDEYRYEIMKDLVNGFISIEKESISEFAIDLVKKASFIRVVGTARQDVIVTESQHAGRRYLKSLEALMNKKFTHETEKRSYFRVIPRPSKAPLEDHIRICAENSKKTGNDFKYKEVQPFAFYLSYQLFDHTDMLLIVDNKSHTGASDNALCFWTRNQLIIAAFISHFDVAWKE
jgi:hypothetical protein